MSTMALRDRSGGVRRFQNPDGSLTEAGRARYLQPNGEFNYRERNKNKKGVAVYKNYRAYEEKQARDEIDSVVKMPRAASSERKKKAAREREILEGWDDKYANDPDYGKKLARSIALQHIIGEKSYNQWRGEGVSSKAKAAGERYHQMLSSWLDHEIDTTSWTKQRNELSNKLASVVLDDIGFENNDDNRRLILPYIFTD